VCGGRGGEDYRVKQLQCNRSTSEVNAIRVPYYRDISNRPQRNFTDHDHGIIIEYTFLVIIIFTFEEITSFEIGTWYIRTVEFSFLYNV